MKLTWEEFQIFMKDLQLHYKTLMQFQALVDVAKKIPQESAELLVQTPLNALRKSLNALIKEEEEGSCDGKINSENNDDQAMLLKMIDTLNYVLKASLNPGVDSEFESSFTYLSSVFNGVLESLPVLTALRAHFEAIKTMKLRVEELETVIIPALIEDKGFNPDEQENKNQLLSLLKSECNQKNQRENDLLRQIAHQEKVEETMMWAKE